MAWLGRYVQKEKSAIFLSIITEKHEISGPKEQRSGGRTLQAEVRERGLEELW